MKTFFALSVLSGAFLLAGCAGVSGDFECDATTSDRCMTMGQANQKARQQSDAAVGKPAAGALPGLVNPPPQASVTRTSPAVVAATPVQRPAQAPASRPFTPVKSAASLTTMPVAACSPLRCDSAGQAHAQRTPEKITYVWVAPWVDTDDVFHQPGRVSFVTDAARWQLPQSVH